MNLDPKLALGSDDEDYNEDEDPEEEQLCGEDEYEVVEMIVEEEDEKEGSCEEGIRGGHSNDNKKHEPTLFPKSKASVVNETIEKSKKRTSYIHDAEAPVAVSKKSRCNNENAEGHSVDVLEDPETARLTAMFRDVMAKLAAGKLAGDCADHERSPSPPPIYDDLGIRINTREARARVKLIELRNRIVYELIQRNPSFEPPSDYKAPKFHKTILVYPEEYYVENFVDGLKRIERQTGALIDMRSSEAGSPENVFTHENLHIYIEVEEPWLLVSAVEKVQTFLLSMRKQLSTGTSLPALSKHGSPPLPTHKPQNENSGIARDKEKFHAGDLLSYIPSGNDQLKTQKEFDETKLFIAGLPSNVDDEKLTELFSPFGDLCEATVLKDKSTGQSEGYGFVRFSDSSSASQAISMMNGHSIDGKELAVGIYGISRSTNASAAELPKAVDERKIFVGSLPPYIDSDKLKELFLPFGHVVGVVVLKDRKTGLSRGSGFVHYNDASSSARAVSEMNGCKVGGKLLAVRIAGIQPPDSSGSEDKTFKEVSETKLFVGNLPFDIDEHKLRTLFFPFGSLNDVIVLRTKKSGKSKGCGFVGFVDTSSAARAVSLMNNYKLDGREITVRLAGVPHSSGSKGKAPKEVDDARLYVGGLPFTVNENQLISLFSPFGSLNYASILKHKSTSRSKGCGFVGFVDPSCAAQAVSLMNGHVLDGRKLIVRVANIHLSNSPGSEDTVKVIDEKRLFVGGLPFDVDENKLQELFLPFGYLNHSSILKYSSTGKSKGCGFVGFVDPSSAARAVSLMNGSKVDGRVISVKIAGGTAPPDSSGSENKLDNVTAGSGTNLFVGQLPSFFNNDHLMELFLPFGPISSAWIVKDDMGQSKGCGFVQYTHPVFASQAAATMNGYNIDGKILAVKVAPYAGGGGSQMNQGPGKNQPVPSARASSQTYEYPNISYHPNANPFTGYGPSPSPYYWHSQVAPALNSRPFSEVPYFPGYRSGFQNERSLKGPPVPGLLKGFGGNLS